MSSSRRYCIRCGKEIGTSRVCDGPECADLPNFYRDVPGPDGRQTSQVRQAGGDSPGAATASVGDFGRDAARMTVAIGGVEIAFLKAIDASHGEYSIVEGDLLVGARAPAQIFIDRPEVSSKHARIVCRNDSGQWIVEVIDEGSLNGTFVNDKKVMRSRLRDGDEVRFASVAFKFQFAEADTGRVTMQLES